MRLMNIQAALALVALALVAMTSIASAESPAVQRGRTLARTLCASCHSIDKVGPSPLRDAPPFRTLHQRYPVERLEEALAEGIVTGHPSMPQFSFDPGQVRDFIAFLHTLE